MLIDVIYAQNSFLYHFKDGVATEKLISDPALFDLLVSAALASPNTANVGGNAALMAKHLADIVSGSGSVVLGGAVGEKIARLLGDSIQLAVPVSDGNALSKDEIHLILEFSTGDTFEGATAPRASRFIVSSDRSNGVYCVYVCFPFCFTDTSRVCF